MTLADDLTDYVAVTTAIEDIPAGAECDLGTGWLEHVRDIDTRGRDVVLIHEDHTGERVEYAAHKGTPVDQYVRVPRDPALTETDRQAIARLVVDAPAFSRSQRDFLSRALAPGVREEIARRGTGEAA